MDRFRPGPVYPITASPKGGGPGHIELAKLFLDSGIRFFQVREKEAADAVRLQQLVAINRLCADYDARLIVNDRIDLALASGAAGVHLGQDDLPVEAGRRLGGDRLILGLSTHTKDEFLAAQSLDVDYVAIGPVYASTTKSGRHRPLGLEQVRELVSRKRRPVVAIGGITLARARLLWEAGVDSVAVIYDIIHASDPSSQINRYLQAGQG